ncbi:MAG: FecR domain-containing protein [Verrucomicrobium sp.]
MTTKKSRLFPLVLAGSLLTLPGALLAAGYTKAEVTRLYNDVKVLKENVTPRDAAVGDQIDSVTSVATGSGSRAELKFPDNSLTRLGANSRFTLRGDQRTLDLDQGVMLLQVPKKLGGAKVRTAAVTAAVTGTTVLFEYLPGGFVKLIVIEGVVDLYFNNDPSKFSHITAGQMIIMKTDSKNLPAPVDVDLSLLLKTSKLISGDDSSMPNFMEVARALQQQQKELKKGDLVATKFVLPGRGTVVELSTDVRTNIFKNIGIKDGAPNPGTNGSPPGNGNNGNGNNGGGNPNNGPQFAGHVPLISGTSFLGNGGLVETNPHVTVYNTITGPESRSAGALYDANPDTEVNPTFTPFPYFAFGSANPVENENFQNFLGGTFPYDPPIPTDGGGYYGPDLRWAVFKFEELVIDGTPSFDFPITTFVAGDPVRNVVFSSQYNLTLQPYYGGGDDEGYSDSFDVRGIYDLDKVVFYSQEGEVRLEGGFSVKGDHQDFAFVAAGLQSDVTLLGSVSTHGDVLVSAGRDFSLRNQIKAKTVDAAAGRDIEVISGGDAPPGKIIAKQSVELRAGRSIKIGDSTTLKLICANEDAVMKLLAKGGNIDIGTEFAGPYATNKLSAPNIDIEAVNGNNLPGNINIYWSDINASNVLRARTVGPDGWITIGNSTLTGTNALKLYAEGARGGVKFIGNTTLNGNEVHIAGRTVQVLPYSNVYINSGNANVYADPSGRLFQVNGAVGSNGQIHVNSGTGTLNVQSFESRPGY